MVYYRSNPPFVNVNFGISHVFFTFNYEGRGLMMRYGKNRNWQGETIGASAAPKTLHQGISYPGPVRANWLENNNKQFAPVT